MDTQNKNIANNMVHTIYDMVRNRDVKVKNLYGRVAKRLYKQHITAGAMPEMVIIPNDLKYYPDSGRFRRIKDPTSPIDYSKIPVNERSSFKNYMSSFTITNSTNIAAYAGIDLINAFKPKLQQMLAIHGGLKFYMDVQCQMVKYQS